MMHLPASVRVYLCASACDMRKSFLTLSGLVAAMGHSITAGDVFLFVGKNKRRAKVLWHDGTGLCLLGKRLDQGRFAALWNSEAGDVELTMSELRLLLEGCQLVGKMQLSPPPIDITKASRIRANDFR